MIKTLLKIRFRSALGNLSGGKKKDGKSHVSKGKIIAVSVAYLYLILVFGGFLTLMAVSSAPVLIAFGLDWFYFAMFTVLAFAVIFILSIFETKSELFECKDNELLLSMPIKPRDIVLSRIFMVLIFNYLEGLLVMLPAIICYVIFGGSAVGIIGSVLVLLLLPLLATSLSAGVGYLVALLVKRMKKNSFVTVGISLVFLLLYFWGYSKFIGSTEEGGIDYVAMSESFSGLRFLGEVSLLHKVFTPIFVAVVVLVSFVAYYAISRSYISIVTATTGTKNRDYKVTKYKRTSQFTAIAKKEFSRFFSSASYMLNSAIGIVFTVLIAIAAAANKNNLSALVGEISVELGTDLSGAYAAVMCAAIVMTSSLNLISASALSLEGKSFWILPSMPVSAGTFLLAKTVPAIAVPMIPNLITSVLFIITAEADFVHALFMILVPQAAGVVSAFLGIVLNGALPKFNYENEVQVVKQSAAMFIAMLAATLYGIINIALAIVFSVVLGNSILGMAMMLVLAVVILTILVAVILGPLTRKYSKYSE